MVVGGCRAGRFRCKRAARGRYLCKRIERSHNGMRRFSNGNTHTAHTTRTRAARLVAPRLSTNHEHPTSLHPRFDAVRTNSRPNPKPPPPQYDTPTHHVTPHLFTPPPGAPQPALAAHPTTHLGSPDPEPGAGAACSFCGGARPQAVAAAGGGSTCAAASSPSTATRSHRARRPSGPAPPGGGWPPSYGSRGVGRGTDCTAGVGTQTPEFKK